MNFFAFKVLAEDAIKAAILDYKVKRKQSA
jgi:hypothetical protein